MSNIKHNPTERFLNLLLIIINLIIASSIVDLMTLKGGTSGACAACKYQRRRCTEDCPLAPYFPAEQTKLFQNVHRLFGVRSIVKILENLDESQKPEAMKSIIFQSYIRDRSPIHGCLGVTQQLQYMIWHVEEELKIVNSRIHLFRSQQQQNGGHNNQIHGDNKQEDVTSQQLDLGMGLNVNNSNITPFFSALQVSETQQQPQMSYGYSEVNGYNSPDPLYTDSKEIQIQTNGWGQNQNVYPYNSNIGYEEDDFKNHNNKGVMGIQSHQEDHDVSHEYDAIHQFLEITDERQSFVDQKEVYASSSGETSKEQIGEIGENELRSAATCFSLTSV